MNLSDNRSSCVVENQIDGGWLWVITVIGAVIVVISAVGNGIIITAFLTYRRLRKPCNIMLTNIAFCDIVFSVISFPFFIAPYFHHNAYCNDAFMNLRFAVLYFTICLCMSSLLLTSVERFVGIQFPYQYQMWMTNVKCIVAVIISWLVALARGIHASLRFSQLDANSSRFGELTLSLVGFLLTLTIYCRVYCISRRHLRRDAALGVRNQYSKAQASVMIAAVFLVCWLIPIVIWLVDAIVGNTKHCRQLSVLPPLLGTVINLYVYTYRIRDFREAIRYMLKLESQIRNRSSAQFPGETIDIWISNR